jgi:hypothetical protein
VAGVRGTNQHEMGREKQPHREYGHRPWGSSGIGASDSRSRPVGVARIGAPVPTTESNVNDTRFGSTGAAMAILPRGCC